MQQNSPTSSTEAERSFWAFKALAFGVGLFSEPVSVATGLIGVAQSFLLGGPVNDLKDAGYEDIEATSYWGSGVGNFSSPTRQYCFNVVDWYQNATKPSSFYGIKIWAQVSLSHPYHNPYDVNVIWLGPIYLRIHRSHALSISVSSGGTTDPAPGTYTYHYGASVTVTAIADSHYYFDHWILDGKTLSPHPPNTYNPILLLMDSDHNLKACFNWMNHAPDTPSLTGPNSGYVGWSYTYKACATDPDGDSVKYTFYWGDGYTTTSYYGSGVEVSRSHSWSSTGTYSVKVKATDLYGAYKYSSSLTVAIHSVPGGCPILYVWNGAEHVCEGLLDIHNSEGVDVIYEHTLVTTPQRVKGAYLLRLTEHPQTHSYIDEVNLYAVLENGKTIELPLIRAWHSEDGNVLPRLLHSDEWKADTLGADHNNGTSQSIDLKFAALSPNLEIAGFMFQIEGNNPWWKL